MRAVTFYSYKGGVGRTLALANVAEYLVRFNKKVCIMDFDLEAPGLRYKLEEKSNDKVPLQIGLVEYMHYFFEFTKQSAFPESLKKYSQEVKFKNHPENPVTFIPAGNSEMASYWNKLSKLDWNSYFEKSSRSKGYGNLFFLELKERVKLEFKPDILLIDCRTGISTVFGITNAVLSEYSIVLAANNDENIDGSIMVLRNLSDHKNHLLKKHRKLHFVLTRIPYPENAAEKIREKNRLKSVKQKLDKELPQNAIDKVMVIHSDRELEWKEELKISGDRTQPITQDYLRLFDAITADGFLNREELERAEEIEKSAELYEQALNEKDPEKQIALLTEALELDEGNYDALFKRAYIYGAKLNKLTEALEDYNNYIEQNPEDAIAYNNRGNIYANLEKYEEALKDHDKAIDLNPEAVEIYNNRGNVYDDLEKYEEALKDYDKAIDLNPEYAKAYNNRGIIYRKLEEYEKALKDYSKAIDLNPEDADAYYNRGVTFNKLEEYEKALKNYSKAIDLNPESAKAYYNRGNVYDDLKKCEKALKDYSKAIDLNPEDAAAYNNRGVAYENLKQYKAALKDYEKALELDPNNEIVKNNKENLLEKMKNEK